MGKVVYWNGVSTLSSDPARCVERASSMELTSVVIVGLDADGDEVFISSEADGAQALWHLERARHKLMRIVDELSGVLRASINAPEGEG
jgi:hypothetical protein